MDALPNADFCAEPCEPICAGGEWVSPAIAVAKDLENGRGRGLVLKSPVSALDVLIVAEAFVVAPLQDLHAATLRLLADESVDPRRRAQFLVLSDGSGTSSDIDIDLYRTGPFPVPGEVDEARVKRVLQVNGRHLGPSAPSDSNSSPVQAGDAKKPRSERESCGVWLLPSLLNHSCAPTTGFIYLDNKYVCIFAARDLRAGDELTDSYVDIFCPRRQRLKELHEQKGFNCACSRCEKEKMLPDLVVNRTLDRQFNADLRLRKEGSGGVAQWAEEVKGVRDAIDKAVGSTMKSQGHEEDEAFLRAAFLEAELVAVRTLFAITGKDASPPPLCSRGAVAGMRAGASIEAVAPWTMPHIEALWMTLQMWVRAGKATSTAATATAQALVAAWCGRHGVALGWPRDLGENCLHAFGRREDAVPEAMEVLRTVLKDLVASGHSQGWCQVVRHIFGSSPLTKPPG
mmetsp:Transcript_38102/g.109958  ORF Transcript_38102/g.109958 Transcript_38102/m.109958 type:complete len:458 (+) Transcript_38102:23-1396(+)